MTLELWQLMVLTGLGTIAGWINVMAGGGSVLTVPVMVFMGLPGPVANGTNRISIIAQNIVAVWGFFSKGFSDFRLSASLAVFAAVGAVFGASVGDQYKDDYPGKNPVKPNPINGHTDR
ncbi:MAG: sulfite exporter TauE/SafE family protein, partial [Pseudomonadota bacterium]